VPAKLAARARVFDTGQGRKTDATDAHAIVMVALRDKGLRELPRTRSWPCCGCCVTAVMRSPGPGRRR
jgi:hypothetical protein